MDLWDVATNFLVSNITGKNYRITDILALANTVKIQLKPPRNANSGQVTFLLRDLLDDVKKHHQVLDFVSKMCCVKPFEAMGNQLKDHLMNESILCMNGTLRTVHDQQKEIARMKHFMNSMKDMSVLDSPKQSPGVNHRSRPLAMNRSNGPLRRSASMARPPSGANNNSDEKIGPEMIRTPDINEIDFQTMIKQMNSQLWEQKKAVSKVSKLCLGALTSVEQLESRVNKEGIQGNNETQTNQPMERIKKLVEDTAKLNNYMQEIDVHLEGVDKKVNEEMPRNLLLNKMFTKLDQEMGDTKVSIKGLHEDMRIFASEVTEESKSATDRVKKLEKYVVEIWEDNIKSKSDDDKSRRFEEKIEMVKEDGKNWRKDLSRTERKFESSQLEEEQKSKAFELTLGQMKTDISNLGEGMVQNGTNLLKRENDFEAKLRSLIEAELQKIKEQQSQSSKNQTDKISKIEQVCVEMNKKFMSDMNQINSKSCADKKLAENWKSDTRNELDTLKSDIGNVREKVQVSSNKSDKIVKEMKTEMIGIEDKVENSLANRLDQQIVKVIWGLTPL